MIKPSNSNLSCIFFIMFSSLFANMLSSWHHIFLLWFLNIFAKQVYESDLYGFLAIEEIVFGNASEILIDPSEEKLKAEFSGVKRSFVPLHSIIRIDEVKERGLCKITDYDGGDNVTAFPSSSGGKNNSE